MSVFTKTPADEIFRKYTHKGWLALCPVWFNERTLDVSERDGIPEWWLTANILLLDFIADCRFLLGLEGWGGWPILKTGRIGTGATR